jgi:hypothetical protein
LPLDEVAGFGPSTEGQPRCELGIRRQLLAPGEAPVRKGIAPELQVNQAEGSLAQAEAQIPVLEAGLDAAMNALDVLLGAQPGTYRAELSAAMPVPVAPGLAETGTPGEMIRRRPDLILAERRLAAANARIGVAMSEYYPKFSLGALLGSATTIASGNLFTGGATQAQGCDTTSNGSRRHLIGTAGKASRTALSAARYGPRAEVAEHRGQWKSVPSTETAAR